MSYVTADLFQQLPAEYLPNTPTAVQPLLISCIQTSFGHGTQKNKLIAPGCTIYAAREP